MDRRLQEEACSNSLNNRRLSRRNFEIGDCARPPPPPPPTVTATTTPRNDCPNDTSFLSQRPIIAAHRNAEIVAWKSAVRTRPWQNERGGRKIERERERKAEAREKEKEGEGREEGRGDSFRSPWTSAFTLTLLRLRACVCVRVCVLDSVQPFGNPDFPIIHDPP